MLKHYLITTLRVLNRNSLYSLLNIMGLATGLAACLMILQYVRFERSYEDMYSQAERIVRITLDYYEGESLTDQDAMSYIPLGPRVVREIPEAIDFARFQYMETQDFSYEGQAYREDKVYLATASCLDLFSYKFIEGDPHTALKAPYEVLITEEIAQKYFGKIAPIGKLLTINYGEGQVRLSVVGVIEKLPLNTHLKFDMLVSYKTAFAAYGDSWEYQEDNWNSNNDYTYILLNSEEEIPTFNKKLEALTDRLHQEGFMEEERMVAQPIKDIHLHSHRPFEAEPNGDGQSVQFLQIIAFFILLMAIVNYINMATARALERAREVGIRKTIGSRRQQLIIQFLFETALIHLLAGLVALSIIQAFQPIFEYLTGIPIQGFFIKDVLFWAQLLGLLSLSIVLSGLYPAWILSSYKPILMLKGNFVHSGKGRLLRKGLIVTQFSLSLMLIVGLGVFRSQLIYMKNKDLGTNIEQTLVLRSPNMDSLQNNFPGFRNTILQHPDVQSIALSNVVQGNSILEMSTTTGIGLHGSKERNNLAFYMQWIDEHYLPQMGIELLAGKDFEVNSKGYKVLINERAMEEWKIGSPEEAIGQQIDYWGETWTIMGVVKNYHQRSVKEPFLPMIMMYSNGFWGFASVKISTDKLPGLIQDMKETWDRHFLGSAFTYFFLDENFDLQYATDQRFLQLFSLLTALAILIAALGLIGLASYMALKRTKEIGIRKVLGASISQIWTLLSKDFFALIGIATAISLPLIWLGIQNWLNRFPFRTELDGWTFLIPIGILLVLATLSISFQILRAAQVNPVESLKYE